MHGHRFFESCRPDANVSCLLNSQMVHDKKHVRRYLALRPSTSFEGDIPLTSDLYEVE